MSFKIGFTITIKTHKLYQYLRYNILCSMELRIVLENSQVLFKLVQTTVIPVFLTK